MKVINELVKAQDSTFETLFLVTATGFEPKTSISKRTLNNFAKLAK